MWRRQTKAKVQADTAAPWRPAQFCYQPSGEQWGVRWKLAQSGRTAELLCGAFGQRGYASKASSFQGGAGGARRT